MILVHNPFLPTPDSSDRESKNEQSNFEDMVTYMDKLIGRIIRKTEALGISDRTLVIFTGDNGTNRKIQSVLDNRLVQGGKGLTTDAGNRVPLIAYWPGTIPGGQVSDDLIDFSDILPTLLEAAEVKVPGQIDGRTFFPQLTGQPGSPRDWFYTYYNPRPERTEPVRFVRDQRWKLYGNGLFFDIADDPLEQNPVLEPPDEVRKKLSRALASMPEEGMSLLEYAP
jgi:arylsulfatase A